ncbi:hypothetical protein OG625_13995 [Streptomyces sp. NBC_01351]|uniref:hypothetical protein n=1 Tax=Streptomyces sp. NBC_01351 TaxID=2903833 RepID=UPI002E369C9E|nr:hypothetical protein [Streptomyces sp. NBC_01351]
MTDQLDMRTRRTAHRGVAAVAGILLLAALTGCGSLTDEPPADRTPKTVPANGKTTGTAKDPEAPPRMILRGKDDPTAGLLALLPGTLVVTDKNCIAVKSETDGGTVALNWGHGWTARVEDGKAVVYDARGKVFAREGDKVSLGGGTSSRFADHPCAERGMFAVNNAPTDK